MKKILLFFTVCLFVCVSAFAQTKTVTGKVISGDDQQGIPGATVLVKETNKGEATDFDGNFSIQVSKGQTLQFSAIGYADQTIAVGDNDVINVTLQQDVSILTEAVVVGYGTQKRINLTGAVASIDVNKTLDSRPIVDVGRGLQGVSPGVNITIPSGEVGMDPVIKIRGAVTSLHGGATSPLILYDNVEIPSVSIINPSDIESISILKDAASASIYGAKASGGVILITSKKGSRTETVTVNYNNNFSWQNAAYDIDMAQLDGLRYTMDAYNRTSGGGSVGAFWYVNDRSLKNAIAWKEKYGGKIGHNDPVVYGRDWYVEPGSTYKMGLRTYSAYDHMVKEWAPSQNHSLSISGKSGNTLYNIGLGYVLQSGMMKPAKKDEFERYNTSISLTTEVNKWLTVKAGSVYSKREKRYPYITNSTTADPWLYLYRWGPLFPMGYDENGNILRSPASEAAQAGTASHYNSYTSVNLGGTVTFTPNWTLDADFTYYENNFVWERPGTRYTAANTWVAPALKNDENGNQIYIDDEWNINSGSPIAAYMLPYQTYTADGANPDHIYRISSLRKNTTTNIYSTYNLNLFEKHAFKFMIGLNRVTRKEKANSSQVTHLLDISNPQFSLADGAQSVTGTSTWEAQLGYFGRINYTFMDKYLLEFNLRYDGTSKFIERLWWQWYPSASVGWNLSNESFFEPLKSVWSFAKMRASYGSIGDQAVANSMYLPTMSIPSGTTGSGWLSSSSTASVYYNTPAVVSQEISWQSIRTFDIGIDFRFFKNKLGITFDWYQRTTDDMIVGGRSMPTTFGTSGPNGNYGSLRTTGWEIAVDFNHRFENGIGLNVMASLTDYKTKIMKAAEEQSKNVTNNTETAAAYWWEGRTYGDIYGYVTDGLYRWEDFELIDPSKGYRWDNLKMITLGGADDPNAGRNYGYSQGKRVYMLKNHNTAVYQAGLQSGALYFGPGDVKYKDLNGDGDIYYGTGYLPLNADDKDSNIGDLAIIGNTTPRMEYGLRIGADWKGFDFSIFIQGIGKREVLPNGFLAVPGFNSSDGAMPQVIAGNYWTWDEESQTGRTGAFYPRAVNVAGANPGYGSGAFNNAVQSRYLLDMSYTRIKNITFGYSLPVDIIKKVYLNKARVYISLENYFTFDNLNGLPVDPEEVSGYSMFDTSNYNSSRTGVGTPTFKSLSFGVQLTF
ncbi:MAG: SusC/RagA family TonB-linked outer membrane protein [Prevotellaceae bacterium]|jgi:TonB-linked SusC/RagA family outer membrane protein|nr:SusC/RagA family TonB-linked outer membrane protein [Prevotellaceae bacterium]